MPPRTLRPKDETGAPEGSDRSDGHSNKRRAVSSACIPCRKRKSKCDGNQPSCSTCVAVYRTECYYDADSDHRRKGALKRDLQSLQQQNDALDVIVASLRSLPEEEAISLLGQLRNDANYDMLAASLRTDVRLPGSFGSQSLEADLTHPVADGTSSNTSHEGTPFGSTVQSPQQTLPRSQQMSVTSTPSDVPASWFRVPQDAELIEHLLNLYFSWVHPFYHLFSREHFLHDMARGRTEYCSPLLVNAVMAFACHYSDRPSARSEPNNPTTAGDLFFSEAKRLLNSEEQTNLTTVQALGVMSVRESSRGRDSIGYQYAGRAGRMALELGLHLSAIGKGLRSSEVEVRKITFWGVFGLETRCALSFGRPSQIPSAAADIEKPMINERTETQHWRPYIDTNLAPSPSAEQPARPILYIQHLSRLSQLASETVNTYYVPQERLTSRRLAGAYAQFQEWYRNLPDCFRLENTSLPHVLVLHMYYYCSVLHLFRPYIKLDLRVVNLYPRDTCTICANEISALMNALRGMYGLRRVCLAVCSMLLSASAIHLLNLPSELAASNLNQALQDLQVISVNHQFATKAIDIIRSLANKWNIALPDGAAAALATQRAGFSASWPSSPMSSFFAASIPRKVSSGSGTRATDSGGQNDSPFAPPPPQQEQQNMSHNMQQQTADYYTTDNSALGDPVQAYSSFWTPFPSQGMPIQMQNMDAMFYDFPQGERVHDFERQQHWQPGSEHHARHHSAPGGLDGGMEDGDFSGWSWT